MSAQVVTKPADVFAVLPRTSGGPIATYRTYQEAIERAKAMAAAPANTGKEFLVLQVVRGFKASIPPVDESAYSKD